jgi:H+/Cl- antiporter ClcA
VRRQTTIGQELLWLLAFLGIFAAVAALLLAYASSHRYNDRIAISLAAILAGVVTIALRARFLGSNARRP